MTAPALRLAPAAEAPRQRHQRVDGAMALRVGRNGIEHLYQRAPCRMLFPRAERGEPLQAVAITTSGGVTAGDRLDTTVTVRAGAALTVSTQAAEKIYRALDGEPDVRVSTRLVVEDGAWCEWLGQEAILFDRARVRRTLDIDLAGSARLLAVESLVFGRIAMGETVASGRVHDRWTIRRDGRLLWVDALHLDGDLEAARDQPFGFGGATALATIVYAGADARRHLDTVRPLTGGDGGATCLDDLLIVRLIGRNPETMRAAVVRIASALRSNAGDYSPTLPAIWRC